MPTDDIKSLVSPLFIYFVFVCLVISMSQSRPFVCLVIPAAQEMIRFDSVEIDQQSVSLPPFTTPRGPVIARKTSIHQLNNETTNW